MVRKASAARAQSYLICEDGATSPVAARLSASASVTACGRVSSDATG
jgi:hypothetical protein